MAKRTQEELEALIKQYEAEQVGAIIGVNGDVVPKVVSRRQFVQQLIIEGMDESVGQVIDAITDTTQRKLMWSWYNDVGEFERNHPQLIAMATAIGKDEASMDQFFSDAAKL
mgnify:CR=1 FL=1